MATADDAQRQRIHARCRVPLPHAHRRPHASSLFCERLSIRDLKTQAVAQRHAPREVALPLGRALGPQLRRLLVVVDAARRGVARKHTATPRLSLSFLRAREIFRGGAGGRAAWCTIRS